MASRETVRVASAFMLKSTGWFGLVISAVECVGLVILMSNIDPYGSGTLPGRLILAGAVWTIVFWSQIRLSRWACIFSAVAACLFAAGYVYLQLSGRIPEPAPGDHVPELLLLYPATQVAAAMGPSGLVLAVAFAVVEMLAVIAGWRSIWPTVHGIAANSLQA